MNNETPRLGQAAVALRVNGASFSDVAETLGLASARNAMHVVFRELAADYDGAEQDKDNLRREAAAQLDSLIASIMGKATDPNSDDHIPAIRTAVTVIDRKIKLFGLDAPTEISIHTPTQTELDQWVNTMVSHAIPVQALQEPDIIDADVVEGSDDNIDA